MSRVIAIVGPPLRANIRLDEIEDAKERPL